MGGDAPGRGGKLGDRAAVLDGLVAGDGGATAGPTAGATGNPLG
ncbi:hypothetical protein [Micromonospora siamensis]|uniref:Uncharacterized protein n=1 Tax=Micromonospora siamensis TaxID=299152 RepID=A0A1C5H0A1_9ACTN|nr:hypothetical protein [Micromonospora siamensis]SCG39418.1 hypothetical protein GA0074704_0820 [Micromonospora siamensis]